MTSWIGFFPSHEFLAQILIDIYYVPCTIQDTEDISFNNTK